VSVVATAKLPEIQPRVSRAEHLKKYRFKPGQTGNAGGKPKGAHQRTFTGWLAKIANEPYDPKDKDSPTKLEHLTRVIWKQAEKGHRKPLEIVLERLDPVVKVEVSRHIDAKHEDMAKLLARVRVAALPGRDDDGMPVELIDVPALEAQDVQDGSTKPATVAELCSDEAAGSGI
jgi:hypothetical protein